jgi:nucleotide sugar dehydrogenase
MKIGVVGNGFVGHAMTLLRPHIEVLVWDVVPEKRDPETLDMETFVDESEIIFIAVPTPMNKDGSCNINIVRSVCEEIQEIDDTKYIVLRSTVPPGTSEELDVNFMPEFLTEKNWKDDFKNCDQWILGSVDPFLYEKMKRMFELAHNNGDGAVVNKNIIQCKPSEAEMIKYLKNVFLSVKVGFFNELESICSELDIDYENVRCIATQDKRIGTGHTKVPGHDGKRGFGGTCFPKDTNALAKFAKENGIDSPILNAVIKRNEKIDRPEKDWESDKGRAVSNTIKTNNRQRSKLRK